MTREDLDRLVAGMVPAIKEYIDQRLAALETPDKQAGEALRKSLEDLEKEDA